MTSPNCPRMIPGRFRDGRSLAMRAIVLCIAGIRRVIGTLRHVFAGRGLVFSLLYDDNVTDHTTHPRHPYVSNPGGLP